MDDSQRERQSLFLIHFVDNLNKELYFVYRLRGSQATSFSIFHYIRRADYYYSLTL